MSTESALMRRALQRHVLPQLKLLGFSGNLTKARRERGAVQDLIALQWSKYGGEFLFEFGSLPSGPLRTSWGEIVAPEQLTVAHIFPTARARLVEFGYAPGSPLGGFRFKEFNGESAQCERLALRVAGLLPHLDAWLRERAIHPHVRPL